MVSKVNLAQSLGVIVLAGQVVVYAFGILSLSGLGVIAFVLSLGYIVAFALHGTGLTKLIEEANTSTKDAPVTINKEIQEKIVPYNEWPDECYVCGNEIDESMEVRGQIAIHRNEGVDETRAVGLCDECTFTYSTLADNHEELLGFYDCRNDPIDL